MSRYLHYTEYVPLAPTERNRSIRVNHDTDECRGTSKSLKIRRDEYGKVSAYCFRCGKSGSYVEYVSKVRPASVEDEDSHSADRLSLPRDIVSEFAKWPRYARSWVEGYGITEDEARTHGVYFSNVLNRVILSIRYEGELEGYQTRRLVDDGRPKYLTYSKKYAKLRMWSQKHTDGVCIVEDILSYIKCSRHIDTYLLLGTNYTNKDIYNIVSNYNIYYIYLDNDNSIVKRKQIDLKNRLENYGKTVLVTSERQPKELSDSELITLFYGGSV